MMTNSLYYLQKLLKSDQKHQRYWENVKYKNNQKTATSSPTAMDVL